MDIFFALFNQRFRQVQHRDDSPNNSLYNTYPPLDKNRVKHYYSVPKFYSSGDTDIFSSPSLVSRFKRECFLKGHHGCVNTVNFSETGNYIMSGSDDTRILLFDTWTHRLKLDIASTMHIANVFHAINIPYTNENEIISCALDGKVVIHNIEHNQHRIIIQHVNSIHRVAINRQDPQVIYCCCESGQLLKYDRRSDRSETVFNNYNRPLYTLNINPLNGNEMMCGGEKGILTFFDIRKIDVPLFALKHPKNDCNYNVLKRSRIRYSNSTEIVIANNNENENENINESENEDNSHDNMNINVNPNENLNSSDTNNSDNEESNDNEEHEVFEDLSDASVDENLIGCEDDDSENEDNDRLENNYENFEMNTEEEEKEEEDEEEEEEEEEGEGEARIPQFRHLNIFEMFSSNSLTSAKYNFNGTKCVVSYQNGDILLYDLKNQNHDDGISNDYLQLYKGHQNIQTIKEVNFYGRYSEYVISGSDTGHIFMWDTFNGEIVTILEADEIGAVNCIQQHPSYIPYVVSSGLSNTVSVWTPTAEKDVDLDYMKNDLDII